MLLGLFVYMHSLVEYKDVAWFVTHIRLLCLSSARVPVANMLLMRLGLHFMLGDQVFLVCLHAVVFVYPHTSPTPATCNCRD